MKLGKCHKSKYSNGASFENELWNFMFAIFRGSIRRVLWDNLTNDIRVNLRPLVLTQMEISNEVK